MRYFGPYLIAYVTRLKITILPYFSGPRGVAISVPFPEVRNRKGAESGLLLLVFLAVHSDVDHQPTYVVTVDGKENEEE